MQGDLLLVALFLVFGIAAFLFGLVYVVWCIVGGIGRGMWSLLRPWRPVGTAERARTFGRAVYCPRLNCRKVEYRNARFCSQCGAPLSYELQVTNY